MVSRFQRKFIAAFLAIVAGSASLCPAAEVEARLDRDAVTAGNGALLTLRISGGRAGQPEIPEVENLIIDPRGRNQELQMFNGRTTVSVTYNYAVGSNTPGDYQIPAIDVTVDGQKLSTQPLRLKVLAAAANPPAGIQTNPAAPQPAGDEEADSGEKRFGFLTVELAASDRKHAYVGEIAPVRIQAWFPIDSRAQLRSGIQPEGKAFTLHHVSDQPQQTQEIKDGKRYLVVTWYGGISATKAGKYPASLSVNAVVAVRDTSPSKPRLRTGSPFDDIYVPMIQKDVTLKSDDQEIEVRPLPAEGRPAGFTGAVGEFKIDGWEIPNNWKTGEPQQIQARISGSGNFALMDAPALAPADAWKTYPGKDEFTPGDVASFSGSKRFQFSAVPRKGGEQEVALAFSFFDPAAGDYKTLTSQPKNIQVAGENIADEPSSDNPAAAAPVKKDSSLVAQHHELSPPGSLIPLVSRPAFSEMLVFSGVLWAAGIILGWLRIRRENPQRRALAAMEKATLEALHQAEQCAAARDVPGYFAAARLAIQQRLGALWNQPAQAITLAEVNARIPHDSPVARFFQEADRHTYSSQSSGEILPQWKTLLDESLASLTTPVR